MKGKVDIINGAERKMKFFHQNSAYVTYENNLSNNLTVEEYLLIAAHLKMGNKVEIQKKKSTVILQTKINNNKFSFHFLHIRLIT